MTHLLFCIPEALMLPPTNNVIIASTGLWVTNIHTNIHLFYLLRTSGRTTEMIALNIIQNEAHY